MGAYLSNIIVGLDIGTCSIKTVIAEKLPDGKLEIIGVAKHPSQGLRNGVIVNIDAAMACIKLAIEEAEQNAGMEVTSVYTAIGGAQVESINSKGQIGVDPAGKNRPLEISENARLRAIDAAKAVVIPLDKKLIHVIPQEYIIDGLSGYSNPVGILGVRLEVQVHLVMASITAHSNIQQCISRSGYTLESTMLKTLAASLATVHNDEMDLGSILIDLGGGTTDIMVLYKGAPIYTVSIPIGGNMVTNDIATVMRVSVPIAEDIKVNYGCCWISSGNEQNEEVIIPGVGGIPPELSNRYELCEIIQPRMVEILTMCKKEIAHHVNLPSISGSIVLTGGGALLEGVTELAQNVWGTSAVRIGSCSDFGGIDSVYRSPEYATVVGLVMANKNSSENTKNHHRNSDASGKGNILGGVKNFFGKFF